MTIEEAMGAYPWTYLERTSAGPHPAQQEVMLPQQHSHLRQLLCGRHGVTQNRDRRL